MLYFAFALYSISFQFHHPLTAEPQRTPAFLQAAANAEALAEVRQFIDGADESQQGDSWVYVDHATGHAAEPLSGGGAEGRGGSVGGSGYCGGKSWTRRGWTRAVECAIGAVEKA